MSGSGAAAAVPLTIARSGLDALLAALAARGYTLIGPTVRDGAVVLDQLGSAADLPAGWTDVQDAGSYRLARRDDDAVFGHGVGPDSFKRFLFVPELRVWTARRAGGLEVTPAEEPPPRYAFIGVRACDLRAIAVQDRVFLGGRYVDEDYRRRREGAFIVAVNCGHAAATCFCASLGTGPRATEGFDLALTELAGGRFLVEAGSDPGAELLAELPHGPATAADLAEASAAVERAAAQQVRSLEGADVHDLLLRNLEHPRWDDVAERCLACANCTMVCPTCFCSNVDDVTDLAGEEAARVRRWESCFTLSHSYINGGSVRVTAKSRYRQWMTHKLATWIDQFGTSGCVGCGRCIAWCPAAIDITEEAAAIRATDLATEGARHAHD